MYFLTFKRKCQSLSRVQLCDPHGLQPAKLLFLWDSPGKNAGGGCYSLLQGIFPTQRSNLGLLSCKLIPYHLSHQGNPSNLKPDINKFSIRTISPAQNASVSQSWGSLQQKLEVFREYQAVHHVIMEYYCCCSVALLCLTPCDPVDCSMPGFPVLHRLLELAQTHVHWLSDAIQPSRPLSSPSLALNLSQHQGLFQRILYISLKESG